MNIAFVLSTRPEIIKLSPLINLLKKEKKINLYILNTNQHFSKRMSKVFFDFFKITAKTYNLRISRKNQHIFLSESIHKISKFLKKKIPDFVIIQGDTNTSLAGCLSASLVNRNIKECKKIKIAHIESGLRSFDDSMPEEINRKIIDRLSNILFIPTKFDYENLKKENCLVDKKFYIVGNTISDVIKKYLSQSKKSKILNKLNLKKKNFFLITMHRPESVDNFKNLNKLNLILNSIISQYDYDIVFPIHPRTQTKLRKFKVKLNKKIKIINPIEYLDFIKLIKEAKILLTDSGGLQEEAAIIGTPCITIRTTTERQITEIKKVNKIIGYDKNKLLKAIRFFMNNKVSPLKDFGNGFVSKKILKILKLNYKKI
jgi:UDP-N-acetylglucosamine 2-epimerase (non-hydrolysing)